MARSLFLGLGPQTSTLGDTCVRERARHRRGRARPLTPGQPRIRASAGPGPPVPPARPRCSGSCHLTWPPRDLSPPQPGRTQMGAEGNRRALTALAAAAAAAALASPPRRALGQHLGGEARPLGAARAPPSASSRLRLPLPAAEATAPSQATATRLPASSPRVSPHPGRVAVLRAEAGPRVPKVLSWFPGLRPLQGQGPAGRG
ncbi:proapoptotic nucleolar protein 1 [Macaca thibetana thibetana]|uniref:proapoptotic nucleolar protein 1 n=1 Tax=Macaca thibetana thibetana TaxID=257877 RepID=UPI0021BCB129|nr:proapoptotic nucleolar protein 1 [Macaca thibetana thibetana]